ncbi:hypothetical protein K5X82_00595 [Halosquirtibacter xylanolyticus]|uniref:hypothetical protein n=1 Tax=Halosquirtibacter xylanolyticus TaxID=3374599 RepID=UPI0037492DFA|nr:hypothetical protein K5X82_00595 [Prolixibacteraceae bacterium]
MKTLRASIQLFFRQVDISDLIKKRYSSNSITHRKALRLIEEILYDEDITHRGFEEISGYSMDDSERMLQKVQEDWAKSDRNEGRRAHIFGLIYRFCTHVLTLEHNKPTIQFDHMLRWRELSLLLGEDLFTCLFTAYEDLRYRHQRNYFDWAPIISTNNLRLKNLLNKGIAENHFHLFGSSNHYDLSWINLMNNIEGRSKAFNKFKTHKSRNERFTSKNDLELLVWKAAYIRCMLFNKIKELDIIDAAGDPCRETKTEKIDGNEKESSENKKATTLDELFSKQTEQSWMEAGKKEIRSRLSQLQVKIDALKMQYGTAYTIADTTGTPDYCYGHQIVAKNRGANELLTGERWFLYRCFRKVAAETPAFAPYEDLLYLYLLIKQQFRDEIIQQNKQVGFANFSAYQNRKWHFLDGYPLFGSALCSMAVSTTLLNQTIQSLEARITPEDTPDEMCANIRKNDRLCLEKFNEVEHFMAKNGLDQDLPYLKDKNESPLFYNIHFIKKPDSSIKKLGKEISKTIYETATHIALCRHDQLRKTLKVQALSLMNTKWSTRKEGKRIQGIDAASSEFSARPEVFAQTFRYLKFCRSSHNDDNLLEELPEKLPATFHAGEDFYDIADGLRAIDESIKFLNLDNGDRIGHALALGIDAEAYYRCKHSVIMLPRHWLLDNYSWLISRIHKYNLTQFSAYCGSLEREFDVLFQDIYGDFLNEHQHKGANGIQGENLQNQINDYNEFVASEEDGPFHMTHITPTLYFEAWKLRGDNPYYYTSTGYFQRKRMYSLWDEAGENCMYPTGGVKRSSRLVNALYHAYHFNYQVRSRGEEVKQFKVSHTYKQLITAVQKAMQREIASRHIAIECNPSSNVLIGTFRRYDNHPIKEFFNTGLVYDQEKLNECAQLCVSINTDDQGVFSTTLENEYALMAGALEKVTDKEGNRIYKESQIYHWLEHVRTMGLQMSFRNHNKEKR